MTEKAEDKTTETDDESKMFITDGDKPNDEGTPSGEQPADSNVEEEVVVTIGDSPAPEDDHEKAPEWVRELRKNHKDTQSENRKLKAEIEKLKGSGDAPVPLGAKPTLASCDYDEDEFDKQLAAWHDKKRAADEAKAVADKKAKAEADAWQARLDDFGEKKSKLKVRVKDFDDAEAVVDDLFDQTQLGIVVHGADDAALVKYAIGKNPGKAKELASIKDPVKFAFAVAKIEKDLKVTNRKAPPPEKTVTGGTAPKSGAVDSELERLREEARKSGDFTKVNQYRRSKQRAAAG